MRIALIISLISCVGCAVTRKAVLHDPAIVNRIDLYQRRGPLVELTSTIDNPGRIKAIVANVNTFQEGWKPVLVTVPSGQLHSFSRPIATT